MSEWLKCPTSASKDSVLAARAAPERNKMSRTAAWPTRGESSKPQYGETAVAVAEEATMRWRSRSGLARSAYLADRLAAKRNQCQHSFRSACTTAIGANANWCYANLVTQPVYA